MAESGPGTDVTGRKLLRTKAMLSAVGFSAIAGCGGGGDSTDTPADDPADGPGAGPPATETACDQTVGGEFTTESLTGSRGDRHYHDVYEFDASEGDRLSVSMAASFDDPLVVLLHPDDELVDVADGQAGFFDAVIDADLGKDRTCTVVATSWFEESFFEYNRSLQCA